MVAFLLFLAPVSLDFVVFVANVVFLETLDEFFIVFLPFLEFSLSIITYIILLLNRSINFNVNNNPYSAI